VATMTVAQAGGRGMEGAGHDTQQGMQQGAGQNAERNATTEPPQSGARVDARVPPAATSDTTAVGNGLDAVVGAAEGRGRRISVMA
jgi:hypothetical protein